MHRRADRIVAAVGPRTGTPVRPHGNSQPHLPRRSFDGFMPTSLRDQLQAALGTAYRIERELAGGGMSRVFVATEVALGRPVVVKVLHPELAADVTAERFAREIQLVARLQQANIVPLLTAGHTGELPFYTMPFVEGLSLRQRLAERGRLAIPEAIGILRDVARALAYAHDAGVAHRDIKPENVLLSGGAAVVTDFGIAKAITVARTQPFASAITQAGTGIGTPAYMAPEQAAGDPSVDHRADIYAFGCLAYELVAGHPPFQSRVAHELIAAHMTQRPAPVASLRPEVPTVLSTLIARCLEKQPGERPQSARELLDGLDAVATPGGSNRAFALTGRRPLVLAAAVLVVAAIGWIVVARRGTAASPDTGPPAVAVIPFVNVGGDSAQDYLADGLSDELATAVGRIPGVTLAARSGSYRYRGKRDLDVRDVAKALSVGYVVQGTVRQAGDQLRVSAQLTDAKTGVELWSRSYDRTTKDIFRTQDEVVTGISGALRARVAPAAASPAAAAPGATRQGTADAEAYDLYMRAEFALRQRNVGAAAEMFQKAIARDAKFARAHAGLAQTLALLPYFTPTPQSQVFDRVVASAKTALALDSTLAEAWMSLGLTYTHNRRWDEAGAYFERALAADPNDVQTHFQYGRYFLCRGDFTRALAEWARVRAVDPFSALAASWTAYVLGIQQRFPEAVAEAGRALQYDSASVVIRLNIARAYLAAGQMATARRMVDGLWDRTPWSGTRGYVHGITGSRDTAIAILGRLEATPPTLWLRYTGIALIQLGLGDTTSALTSLERATDVGEIWSNFIGALDPLYDPLRQSPRWAVLIKRIGLSDIPGVVR